MNRVVILMYHALYADESELSRISPADRPYAVSVRDFNAQLDLLARDRIAVLDPRILDAANGVVPPGVLLTFDDGHESAFRHALPILAGRGHAAAFFVTTDFVSSRSGFCNWEQLCIMAEQGMSIGTHGRTHRFFDDLDDLTATDEFEQPKLAIEQHLGREVTQMSFPGGRFSPSQLSIGVDQGYRVFHSSRVGVECSRVFEDGVVLPRIAVRRSMSLHRFRQLVNARPIPVLRHKLASEGKGLARRAVGNRLYHYFYEKLSSLSS